MMKKGKGYPEHVKDTGKSFGDPYAEGITGGRVMVLLKITHTIDKLLVLSPA